MINHSGFHEFSKHFDKEFLVEIIDLFTREYPARIETLRKNVEDLDFNGLAENIHSLKGAIATFMAPYPVSLAQQLEDLAKQGEPAELIRKSFLELKSSTEILISELQVLRQEFLA